MYHRKCWCSHNPIFSSNYFVMNSNETRWFLFWEFNSHFTAGQSSSCRHFVNIFCSTERGKLKVCGSFDLIGWKIQQHFLFSSNTQKMSETCRKLAFTHPIIVLKSGPRNNWMQKLDRMNRPLVIVVVCLLWEQLTFAEFCFQIFADILQLWSVPSE